MSYEIYFIKRRDLTLHNVETILETDAQETDSHFVSKALMLEVKHKLRELGLKFEVFERSDEDYVELNFPSYQVCMFNNSIVVSLPYSDFNNNEKISNEITQITNTLLDFGFTGFDTQNEELIVSKQVIKAPYSESKPVANNAQTSTTNNFDYRYLIVGIVIIAIVIILLRLLKR